MLRSKKIQDKVSKIGFDWNNFDEVIQKVFEELEELRNAIKVQDKKNSEEELGDLLFTIVNLARHIDVDPDIKRVGRRFGPVLGPPSS